MDILYLGPDSPLVRFLDEDGNTVRRVEDAVTDFGAADFVISYGYRHILKRPVLDNHYGRAINLHISYLPWNRGADPNLWSFVDGTPKGVSIHHIDYGIDTGDLIAQRQVAFGPEDTLATSYANLQAKIRELFIESWPSIKSRKMARTAQSGYGSYHRSTDKTSVKLPDGWDTPISLILPSGR